MAAMLLAAIVTKPKVIIAYSHICLLHSFYKGMVTSGYGDQPVNVTAAFFPVEKRVQK